MVKICPSIEDNVSSYQTKICAKMFEAVGDEYKTQGYWSGVCWCKDAWGIDIKSKKGKTNIKSCALHKDF